MDWFINMADYLYWIVAVILAVIGLIVARYISLPVIISVQTFMTVSTISMAILLASTAITILVFGYNKLSDLFDYINTSLTALPCFVHLLNCSGVLPALEYGAVLLKSSITSYFIIYLYVVVRKLLVIVSDQLWKLGVLLRP